MISNVINKLMPMIKKWQNRPLEKIYAVVFLDAIHYKVRQEGAIVNKAAYMVIGIDLDGRKDVLGMWIGEHETRSSGWCAQRIAQPRCSGHPDLQLKTLKASVKPSVLASRQGC